MIKTWACDNNNSNNSNTLPFIRSYATLTYEQTYKNTRTGLQNVSGVGEL